MLLTAPVWAQGPDNKAGTNRNPATRLKGGLEGTGVVQYDPGLPVDSFHKNGPTFTGGYYGNIFDTRNGVPLSPGTITGVSWYQGGLGNYGTRGLVDFGPPNGTITTQLSLTPPAPSTFNAIGAAVPANGPKFVGLALGFDAFGSVGARSASTNGQGFHAVQRNWYGNTGTALPGENIMIRISGTIIVPVELMEFDVE
jgi:hypothetical protein